MSRGLLGAFLLFMVPTSCSSGPMAIDQARLEFSAEKIDLAEMPPSVSVEIDQVSRVLEVRGFVTLPCDNYDPKGNVSQIGSLVILTIRTEREQTCALTPSLWSYTGLISNLESAQYTLRVEQPVPDFSFQRNPTEVVFEKEVVIP